MHKRWELWVFIAITLLNGALERHLIPDGIWHSVGMLAQETATGALAFLGVKLVRGKGIEPAGDA